MCLDRRLQVSTVGPDVGRAAGPLADSSGALIRLLGSGSGRRLGGGEAEGSSGVDGLVLSVFLPPLTLWTMSLEEKPLWVSDGLLLREETLAGGFLS